MGNNSRGQYDVEKLGLPITGGRKWNFSVQIYDEAAQIPRMENCFAIMFTNVGAVNAFVNGMVVFPSATPTTALGDSRSVAAHKDDIYRGNITLSFSAGAGAALELVQLFYLEEPQKQ